MMDRSSQRREFESALRQVVEPVVRRAGFDWNSSGLGDDPAARDAFALYEAAPAEFIRRFPTLEPNYAGEEASCIDLWIYYHLDGRTTDANLEGIDIAAWLREHGHPGLAEAMELPSDIEAAMRSLAAGLETMLSEAKQV